MDFYFTGVLSGLPRLLEGGQHGGTVRTMSFSRDSKEYWIKKTIGKRVYDNVEYYDIISGKAIEDPKKEMYKIKKESRLVEDRAPDVHRMKALYYIDERGNKNYITKNYWQKNYGLDKSGRFVVYTNLTDELVVWDTKTKKNAFCSKITNHENGNYLVYDPKKDRFLIGDASHNGTTWLRALEIRKKKPEE